MAAAHFNRLAAERGLDIHAISRGTDPDAVLHPVALAGLSTDGLAPGDNPTLLSNQDLAEAVRIVAFSSLPAAYRAPDNLETWSVPPISEDYQRSRSAILAKIQQLLTDFSQRP